MNEKASRTKKEHPVNKANMDQPQEEFIEAESTPSRDASRRAGEPASKAEKQDTPDQNRSYSL